MNLTREYRIARLKNFLYDFMQDLAELEPCLVDMTDWHTTFDALNQMIKLIENGEV